MEEKVKIVWIDWVKAICMFFVYFHHIGILGSNKVNIVIPYGYFFVNAFFFVSGYLLLKKHLFENSENQNRSIYLKKQFQEKGILSNVVFKIALPSVFFSIIDYLLKLFISGESFAFGAFLFKTLIRGTFWFTCALCVAELTILALLVLLRKKSVWIYFIICALFFLLGKFLTDNGFALYGDVYCPWFYKSGFMACLFLAGGGIFFQYEKRLSWLPTKNGSIVLIFIVYVYCIIVIKEPWGFVNGSVLTGIDYGGILLSFMGIISVRYLCANLPSVKSIEFISRHTIGFYFFSASMPYCWCKIIERLLPTSSSAYMIGVIGSFLSSWLIVYLIDKYIPFVFDFHRFKIMKGR